MMSLRKTVKVTLNAILVSSVIVLLLMGASRIVQPKNTTKESGTLRPEANGVMGERPYSLDALFIGDSEAYASFSPLQMFKDYGFASYTSATPLQKPFYSNTLLHRALETQKPKVAVFETNSFYTPTKPEEAFMRMIQDTFPVFEFHDRWKSLTAKDFLTNPTATWSDPNKGFAVKKGTVPADASNYMTSTFAQQRIPQVNLFYLKQMIAYCKSKGITPVLVSTPSTYNWSMARHNYFAALAKELGVDYLDLNMPENIKKMGIDWETDSYDGGDHLNYNGAKKVSDFVGNYLKTTYGLADHRRDSAYSSWRKELERYEKEVS